MDFFERYMNVSPDGGSGTLEALYIIVPTLVIGARLFWLSLRSRVR